MRLLLDTHALLWALAMPANVPAGDPSGNRRPGEIRVRQRGMRLGNGDQAGARETPIPRCRDRCGGSANLLELPVTVRHAEAAASLPPLHRDPFDRMLVAQAQVEGLSLVSCDPAMRQYQVTVLWGPDLEAPRTTYRVTRKPRRR